MVRSAITQAAAFLLALGLASPAAGTIIQDDGITASVVHDFESLTGTLTIDTILVQPGASYAERFDGQARGTATNVNGEEFDVLSGSPTGPLALVSGGGPGFNLGLRNSAIAGCGPFLGCPALGSYGEGALSILFDQDTGVFGLDLLGAQGGTATFQFFARDGSALGTLNVAASFDRFVGFRVTSGSLIAGVSISNNDMAGLAYDNVTFVPEPSAALLLFTGLLGLGIRARRRPR